jgi:hypothetical protein
MSVISTAAYGGGDVPEIPEWVLVHLPAGYVIRQCGICLVWSVSAVPWLTPDRRMEDSWFGLMPWHRGTVMQPLGNLCKMCPSAFALSGLDMEFRNLKDLQAQSALQPAKFHVFKLSRDLLIKKKCNDPNARIRDPASFRQEVVMMGRVSSVELQAEERFLTEEAYLSEFGHAPDPNSIEVMTFHGQQHSGVRVRDGKPGVFKLVHKESVGVSRTVELAGSDQLREGQAQQAASMAMKKHLLALTTRTSGDCENVSEAAVPTKEDHAVHDDEDDDEEPNFTALWSCFGIQGAAPKAKAAHKAAAKAAGTPAAKASKQHTETQATSVCPLLVYKTNK